MKIIEKEFNAITNEEIVVERDESATETKIRLERAKEIEIAQAEAKARVVARKALLEKLGITEEEAELLLG